MHFTGADVQDVRNIPTAAAEAAGHHGDLRRKQGYTVAMAVEESRLLRVTIFSTLHKNVNSLEFSALLPDVVTKQQMLRFMAADAAERPRASRTLLVK